MTVLANDLIAFEDQRFLQLQYGKSFRKYHGLPHPDHVFTYMGVIKTRYARSLPDFCLNPKFRVLSAAWHDAIYDVTAKDNEEQSALRFASSATAEAHTAEDVAECTAAIRASANHWNPLNEALSPQVKIFLDADLYELGSHYELFHQNALNILEEYSSAMDLELVIKGRENWYRSLLEKDRIFWIATDRDDAVRKNIERALKEVCNCQS